MSLQEIIRMLFKQKMTIFIVFVVTSSVVTYGALVSSPVYLAKSSFLVKPWKDDTRLGIGGNGQSMNLMLSQDELVNTEIQILTGRDLASKVISTLTLQKMYPNLANTKKKDDAMDAAIEQFLKNLKVNAIRKSNVVDVTFQHINPNLASSALNLLLEEFKEKHLALHSDPKSSFIGSQLANFEKKLKDSETNLHNYQQASKVFSLEEQRSLLLRQRSELDTAYKSTINAVSELRSKIPAIKTQLTALSKSVNRYTPTERDKIVIEARTKQLELTLKEQELLRKYNENNPLVVEAKKNLDTVTQYLKEQEENISVKVKTGNPLYQSVEADLFKAESELSALLSKCKTIKSQINQLDREVSTLDRSEARLQNLKREIVMNEKNYSAYADRQEDARISEVMNRLKMSNITIVQAADVPSKPARANKGLKIMMGILVALVLGVAIGYVIESIKGTFSDPESVETYLNVPVLLTVPYKEG